MQPGVTGLATFSGPLDCYRLTLTRTWRPSDSARFALVVGMNPSTARWDMDDTSIAKITRMARRWRNGALGRFVMANTYAYRCTDQMRLAEVEDPIGPENDATIDALASMADMVVFAYGTPKIPALRGRGRAVARRLAAMGVQPHALRLSAAGEPWHPLLLPDDTKPFPWSPT